MRNMESSEKVSSNFDKLGYSDVVQNNPHHFGTVSQHTEAVINAMPDDTSDIMKLAATFHDIGKLKTISVNPKTGFSRFLGHADKSVEMLEANRDVLCPDMTDNDFDYMKELVRLHDTKYSKQGKCQAMLDGHPDGFAKDILLLQYADIMGQSEYQRTEKLQEVQKFAKLIEKTGTPEQTEGLDEVLSMLDEQIKLSEQSLSNIPDAGEKEFLARTASNIDIYVNKETLQHMEAHPDVNIAHICEAIGKLETYSGPFAMSSIDMERTVGKDACVETSPEDKVTHLYRKGRQGTSPIATEKEPEDTSLLTVGICLDDDGRHTMFTSFYGQLAPKEPWDESLTPEEKIKSEQFWSAHALVCPDEAIDWERSKPLLDREVQDNLEEKTESLISQANTLLSETNTPSDVTENVSVALSKMQSNQKEQEKAETGREEKER